MGGFETTILLYEFVSITALPLHFDLPSHTSDVQKRTYISFLLFLNYYLLIHSLWSVSPNRLAEEEKKAMKLMQEAERTYAAEQVFEEWLDQVDRRQSKQIDNVHKRKQRIQHQFPWSPGGSVR